MTEQSREPDQPSTTGTKPRSMGVALWHGVGAGVLGMLVLTAVLVVGVPLMTGAGAYTITDRSMTPMLAPGALVVTQPVDVESIETGDVITYHPAPGDPAIITHRVVDVAGDRLITKGDASAVRDAEPVRETELLGRLWYSVPMLGWVNAAVTGPWRVAALAAVAVAVCGYAAWILVSRSRRSRKR